MGPVMDCQSKRKEDNVHNLQPFQQTAASASETEWANSTSGRYTYIPRRHPGSKTYLGKPAPEEPGQSKDQVSLDEETVKHREGHWSELAKKVVCGENPPSSWIWNGSKLNHCKINSSKLSRVQHQAMRMMTGAMRSTPISAMETVTGLQPIEDRQKIKVLTLTAKFKRLHNHSMHERMNQPTRGRLKRSKFIQHNRNLERKKPWAAWPCTCLNWFQSKPSHLGNEDNSQEYAQQCQGSQTDAVNLSQRGSHWRWSISIDNKYQEDQWTYAYAVSSAADTTQDGGGGVYISYNDGKAHITIATGKYSTCWRSQKSRSWDQRQPTPNQNQCGHLHKCSLCPQHTP